MDYLIFSFLLVKLLHPLFYGKKLKFFVKWQAIFAQFCPQLKKEEFIILSKYYDSF